MGIFGTPNEKNSEVLRIQQKVDSVEARLKNAGFNVVRKNLLLEVTEDGEIVSILINENAKINVEFSGFKFGNVDRVMIEVRQALNRKHNRTREQSQSKIIKVMILKLASYFNAKNQILFSDYQIVIDTDKFNISKLGFKFQTKVFMSFIGLDIHFSAVDIKIEEMTEIQKTLKKIEEYWQIIIL